MALSRGTAVLHVALEPITGVWSVIRDLRKAQIRSGNYAAVGIGVIASRRWPSRYADELKLLGEPSFKAHTVACFGTAQFLFQLLRRPPIFEWTSQMAARFKASEVIVHFHNAWRSGVFVPIREGKVKLRAVATFHGVNPVLARQPARLFLHRYMAQRLAKHRVRLTSVASRSLPLAERLLGLDPSLFAVIPNGISAADTGQSASWPSEEPFAIGYIGALEPQKGWKLIVEAVLKLKTSGRNIKLLLAGAGPQQQCARDFARNSSGVIEYLGHVVSPRSTTMRNLHVLCMMSEYEGLPMVLVEAASVGLPAIATPVGGVPEIIDDGRTGILISRDSSALVKALIRLYDNPALRDRMGHEAQCTFFERFLIDRVTQLYHAAYLSDTAAEEP